MTSPVIVWFRRDLRLDDNPALSRALASGAPLLPVYIWEEDLPRPWGAASRWWLHHSLESLSGDLARRGAPLLLLRGVAARLLPALARRLGAARVICNRRNDPAAAGLDRAVREALAAEGVALEVLAHGLLFEPESVKSRAGQPFQVFTPFWRAALALPEPGAPLPMPERVPGLVPPEPGLDLAALALRPTAPDWAGGLAATWQPGEAGAWRRLTAFLAEGAASYPRRRDLPAEDGTSRLSPHLAFGELSPRRLWHAARAAGLHPAEGFLRELGWREFCHHMLFRFPEMATRPQRAAFERFPWRQDPAQWRAFRQGRTGYPFVDAGLRQLWHSGWMHNRVRMIVASFLVKDLRLPWQWGEAWFWDTLVDADPANNPGGWQWAAGCGMDAAPYFRVFNPVLQGRRFDPDGAYVRRWCPDLADLPAAYLHAPWQAPPLERIGLAYPPPLVEHERARKEALAAFAAIKD